MILLNIPLKLLGKYRFEYIFFIKYFLLDFYTIKNSGYNIININLLIN